MLTLEEMASLTQTSRCSSLRHEEPPYHGLDHQSEVCMLMSVLRSKQAVATVGPRIKSEESFISNAGWTGHHSKRFHDRFQNCISSVSPNANACSMCQNGVPPPRWFCFWFPLKSSLKKRVSSPKQAEEPVASSRSTPKLPGRLIQHRRLSRSRAPWRPGSVGGGLVSEIRLTKRCCVPFTDHFCRLNATRTCIAGLPYCRIAGPHEGLETEGIPCCHVEHSPAPPAS